MKAYIPFQMVSDILKVPRIRHVSRSKNVRRHAIQWWHVLMQGFQGMDPGRALVPYSSDWVADEVLYL